jgi:ribonuclease-3
LAPRPDIAELERRLGYTFRNRAVLREALTHASSRTRSHPDNERLEFLGDRVLGLCVAEMLIARFPAEREGDLARRYNRLVRRETCAAVGRALALGPHLVMMQGEVHAGGREKDAILADACEALLGAAFLDGGFDAAQALVRRLWQPHLDQYAKPLTDAKTALQEFAQSQKRGLPVYEKIRMTGEDHKPCFVVEVRVNGLQPARGEGPSLRKAEQAAAEAMLVREAVWKETESADVRG